MTEFQYSAEKRREIIDAIRGRTTADHDAVIAKLADAAGSRVESKRSPRRIGGKSRVN